MKFLLDEHAEYYQKELEKQNHETETAKRLRTEDPKYRNDYNLIEYAKEHSMTIITKDGDLGQACKDNNFPCILITEDKIFNKIKSGEASRMAQKSSG